MNTIQFMKHLPPTKTMERALKKRDRGFDGIFFVAVKTTGVFCRPSCFRRPVKQFKRAFDRAGDADPWTPTAGSRPGCNDSYAKSTENVPAESLTTGFEVWESSRSKSDAFFFKTMG